MRSFDEIYEECSLYGPYFRAENRVLIHPLMCIQATANAIRIATQSGFCKKILQKIVEI